MNPVDELLAWPHPSRCPSTECRGQFFTLLHYGVICTVRLFQLTNGSDEEIRKLSEEALAEHLDGLGLS